MPTTRWPKRWWLPYWRARKSICLRLQSHLYSRYAYSKSREDMARRLREKLSSSEEKSSQSSTRSSKKPPTTKISLSLPLDFGQSWTLLKLWQNEKAWLFFQYVAGFLELRHQKMCEDLEKPKDPLLLP